MTTWTYSTLFHAIVVTADDVHLAIGLIHKALKEQYKDTLHIPRTISPEDLIPLPTHHRYCRVL